MQYFIPSLFSTIYSKNLIKIHAFAIIIKIEHFFITAKDQGRIIIFELEVKLRI